jgi:hypothetical protein
MKGNHILGNKQGARMLGILKFGCRLVSLLMLTAFLSYAFQAAAGGASVRGYEFILIAVFFFLNLAGSYGLYFIKKWGFWLAYFNIFIISYFKSSLIYLSF